MISVCRTGIWETANVLKNLISQRILEAIVKISTILKLNRIKSYHHDCKKNYHVEDKFQYFCTIISILITELFGIARDLEGEIQYA